MTVKAPRWQLVVGSLVFADICMVALYCLSHRLFAGHSGEVAAGIVRLFDMHVEANVPTWYSASQLLLVAVLGLLVALQLGREPVRGFYYLLAAVFAFFSMDEVATIHESLTGLSKALSLGALLPGGHGAWMLIYPAVAVVVLILMRKGLIQFVRSPRGRLAFLVGGALFVLGGMGAELFGYFAGESLLEVAAEELLELLGVSLMAGALLVRLYVSVPRVEQLPLSQNASEHDAADRGLAADARVTP